MLILYIVILVCPLDVFIWTFRISHESSYRSIGTRIFKWFMYAYGVAGVVGIFRIQSWNLAKFFIFTLGYGIPAIVALIGYYTYLNKKESCVVNEDQMYIKQTIDIKKEDGVVDINESMAVNYQYWTHRKERKEKTVIILPEPTLDIDGNTVSETGEKEDRFSGFAARDIAEELALNGIVVISFGRSGNEELDPDQQATVIDTILKRLEVSGDIVLMAHGLANMDLPLLRKRVGCNGIVSLCPIVAMRSEEKIALFDEMSKAVRTLYITVKNDPFSSKHFDPFALMTASFSLMQYDDIDYTLRTLTKKMRKNRITVHPIGEDSVLDNEVMADIIEWITK